MKKLMALGKISKKNARKPGKIQSKRGEAITESPRVIPTPENQSKFNLHLIAHTARAFYRGTELN